MNEHYCTFVRNTQTYDSWPSEKFRTDLFSKVWSCLAEFLFDALLPYPVGENLLAKKFTCGLNSSTTAQTIRSGNPTR